jgi:hypothetical protein
MSEAVVYRSEVKVERLRGPMREATVPGRMEKVSFGVHGAVADHYGVSPDDFPHDTTTLDYVVAAAVG